MVLSRKFPLSICAKTAFDDFTWNSWHSFSLYGLVSKMQNLATDSSFSFNIHQHGSLAWESCFCPSRFIWSSLPRSDWATWSAPSPDDDDRRRIRWRRKFEERRDVDRSRLGHLLGTLRRWLELNVWRSNHCHSNWFSKFDGKVHKNPTRR